MDVGVVVRMNEMVVVPESSGIKSDSWSFIYHDVKVVDVKSFPTSFMIICDLFLLFAWDMNTATNLLEIFTTVMPC